MSAISAEVHPALVSAARELARHATKAGDVTVAEHGRSYSATEDGVTLSVCLVRGRGSWTVAQARYRVPGDAAELTGVLEAFCRAIEGLPLQEAADHGAIHACNGLRASVPQPLVAGIHTPRSMGAAFMRCERLMRAVLAQYRTVSDDRETRNFWNPALSQQWRLKTAEQQLESLRPVVENFRKSQGLAESEIWVARIEKMRRVVIDFGESVDAARKSALLMDLERAVRTATGERLELYMEELKDNNRIRRLGVQPARAAS